MPVVQQVTSMCPYSSLNSNLVSIIVIHFSSFQWNFIPLKFLGPNKVSEFSRTHHALAAQFPMYVGEEKGWNGLCTKHIERRTQELVLLVSYVLLDRWAGYQHLRVCECVGMRSWPRMSTNIFISVSFENKIICRFYDFSLRFPAFLPQCCNIISYNYFSLV